MPPRHQEMAEFVNKDKDTEDESKREQRVQ